MLKYYLIIAAIAVSVIVYGCGGDNEKDNNNKPADTENKSGLTDWEMKNGIGPVNEEIQLGEIDPRLVSKGEEIFNTKCAACHKLDERYVGPAQRNVIERRSPEYIMNMMLNPEEMLKKHPEAKKMLGEFMTPMPNQNLSREDARAVLEFFRKVNKENK